MKFFRLRRMLLVIVLTLPLEAMAAGLPPELADALNRLAGAKGFSCQFEQTIFFSDGSRQRYQGTLAVLPPGRFRWRYSRPYVQLFVSDGSRIWHYEPDLMQVTVLTRMQGVDPAIMRLLDGRIGLHDVILLAADAVSHRYHVRIGVETKVWLGISEHQLAYVESVDALGNRNRIRLLRLSFRPPAVSVFSFKAPPGVDVVSMDRHGKN